MRRASAVSPAREPAPDLTRYSRAADQGKRSDKVTVALPWRTSTATITTRNAILLQFRRTLGPADGSIVAGGRLTSANLRQDARLRGQSPAEYDCQPRSAELASEVVGSSYKSRGPDARPLGSRQCRDKSG